MDAELIKEEFDAVAKIKVVKTGTKVEQTTTEIFETKHGEPGFSTDIIKYKKSSYALAFTLRCKLEKEDNFFVIQSEKLDIVGTGITIEEAENNFSEEFDFVYRRYNELPENELGERAKRIKLLMNTLVVKP